MDSNVLHTNAMVKASLSRDSPTSLSKHTLFRYKVLGSLENFVKTEAFEAAVINQEKLAEPGCTDKFTRADIKNKRKLQNFPTNKFPIAVAYHGFPNYRSNDCSIWGNVCLNFNTPNQYESVCKQNTTDEQMGAIITYIFKVIHIPPYLP